MNYKQIFNKFRESKEELKVIYPKDSKDSEFNYKQLNKKNAIYLAGFCSKDNDWRENAIEILKNLCFRGTIFNPNNKFQNEDELKEQTTWENEAMHKASAIVFNFDKVSDITNFEIGKWLDTPRTYIYISDSNSQMNKYITIKCNERNIPVYTTLEDCLAALAKDLNIGGRKWFTSDTHFSQERTWTLSRRPFYSVEDMDLAIISNINKRLTIYDDLYILGDFGSSFKYLDCLNYKKLYFIKGNYERERIPEILKEIKDRSDVVIYDNDECKVQVGNYNCVLRHEPITRYKLKKDEYTLFGHIHGKQLIKFNKKDTTIGGLDVGVDAHNYIPCSEEDISFYLNSIEKEYYDSQVKDTLN